MAVYEGKEPYIFVCYSHRDADTVEPVLQYLQAQNFRLWYDAGIEGGEVWSEMTAGHLKKASCVLAFVSPNLAQSDNCQEEIWYAKKLKKPIVPVYLEDTDLSPGIEMTISKFHIYYRDKFSSAFAFHSGIAQATPFRACRGAAPVPTPKPASVAKPKPESVPVAQSQPELSALECTEKGNKFYNEKNYAEAVKWYRKAADQGYAEAQFNLGVCYSTGQGVAVDKAEAVKWFRMAAEQGNADAQFHLGNAYRIGDGVETDKAEAIKWYHKSAERGQPWAQYNLALCYKNGWNVNMDTKQAIFWFRKAAEQGDKDAKHQLRLLGITS